MLYMLFAADMMRLLGMSPKAFAPFWISCRRKF